MADCYYMTYISQMWHPWLHIYSPFFSCFFFNFFVFTRISFYFLKTRSRNEDAWTWRQPLFYSKRNIFKYEFHFCLTHIYVFCFFYPFIPIILESGMTPILLSAINNLHSSLKMVLTKFWYYHCLLVNVFLFQSNLSFPCHVKYLGK